MDFKSKLLNDAVEQMSSLPGVGKRSALRLVLYLLDQSEKEVKDFTQAFLSLKEHLNFCSKCYHITEQKMCEICQNPSRSEELICVVQDIRDLLAIESTQQFYGKYHVLGGVISPMDGIGPNDLKINELMAKFPNQIYYEYRHFPLSKSGPSRIFAQGSVCSGIQGKFFEFLDLSYKNQKQLGTIQPQVFAKQLGLNMSLFNSCLNGEYAVSFVNDDVAEGDRINVTSTPTYVINGIVKVGLISEDDIRSFL